MAARKSRINDRWHRPSRVRQGCRTVLLGFLLGTTACTSARIEYDRMTGTQFPTQQTRNGSTFTLSSIYGAEGYLLGVSEDETNIAALTGPANPNDPTQYEWITEAELDALETGHRTSAVGSRRFLCWNWGIVPSYCTEYHLYGIVVNHKYEDPGGVRRPTILGIMWTTDNRRSFAGFWQNSTVSSDGGKYLRSTAHEVGHAFGLHHEDGDGSTDIMNQTGVVGNSYVYDFAAAASTNHLGTHDKGCVWPGLSAFAATHTNHTDHGYNSGTCP